MADKTIVQKPVKKSDLTDVHLYMVTATPTWSALYIPKDATGAPIGAPRNLTGNVTDAADLYAWVDRIIIAAVNQAESTA